MKIMKDIKEKMQTLEIEKNDLQQILIRQGFDATNIPFIEYHAFLNLGQCDYYVSATGNDSNDGLTQDTAFLTLNQAITTATSGQSIGVLAGTYKGANNCDLSITKNLNIYGTYGTIFDGENTRRSGWVLGDNNTNYSISVNNIIFQNGSTTSYGGGIYSYKGNSIINCIFNNNSGYYGGGIYNIDNNMIDNCIFNNNTANLAGAIENENSNNSSPNTIKNCTFMDNISTWYGGYVIHNMYSNIFQNDDFLTTKCHNIYQGNYSSVIDGCYWNTSTPTTTSYNSELNGSIVTNDRTTPNHPERIVS